MGKRFIYDSSLPNPAYRQATIALGVILGFVVLVSPGLAVWFFITRKPDQVGKTRDDKSKLSQDDVIVHHKDTISAAIIN